MKHTSSLNTILSLSLILISGLGWAQTSLPLASPSQRLDADIRIEKDHIQINLFKGKEKITTVKSLQFTLDKEIVDGDWQVSHELRNSSDLTWQPVFGERSSIRDRYNELVLDLTSGESGKQMQFKVRLYDEGIAFKYAFNELDFWNRTLTDEKTQFLFEHDCPTWVTDRAQGNYTETTLDHATIAADRPQVIQINQDCFAAVGEASLVDYARMKLKKSEAGYGVQSALSGKVNLSIAGYQSPWRYVMIADHPGHLVQNNYFILNLNEPCQIKDTSWIKPGQVLREVTLTTKGGMACVDFAAANHLEYVEFDAGWYGPENDKSSDATTITVDPARSKGVLDLHKVIEYANSKDVGILVYVNMRALHQQLDELLPLYKKWGIKGVKYGFVDVGDQYSTSWLHHAVRLAAKYGLMVDIHDEYRPTGYSRTYPNLVTQEGIRGDEESPSLKQAIHTLYNRMICGAGDYTNCYFDKRVTQKMGGRAAQLAKLVVFHSPWQFIYWYDRPEQSPSRTGGAGSAESIMKKDALTSLYCSIPTVWDETRFLNGEMGTYAVIARRSSSNWYIGILNAGGNRRISIPLDMLDSKADYSSTLYYQKQNRKDVVDIMEIKLPASGPLTIDVEGNSGCVVHLSKGQSIHSNSPRNPQKTRKVLQASNL